MQGEIEAGMPFNDMGAQSLVSHPSLTAAKRIFSPLLVPAYRYELTHSRWRAVLYDGWRSMRRRKEEAAPVSAEAEG
jgi:hypothetical protein